MTKLCEFCAKPLERRPEERSDKFAQRRFCSYLCHNTNKRKVVETRHCEHCKEPIKRRSTEKPNAYLKRRFCSIGCGGRANRGKPPTEAQLAALGRRRSQRKRACKLPKKHSSHFRIPPARRPASKDVSFESPEEWLRTHQVTKCPTMYCAPVYSQRLHDMTVRRDGRVR